MTVTPDAAAAALLESWNLLMASSPEGWLRAEPGCVGVVTGATISTLNGVCVESEQFDAPTVEKLLDEVAATGLPYCLQVRPSCDTDATEVARARGLIRDEDGVPLMVLEDPGRLAATMSVDGLVIRELSPAETDLHVQVAAEGFGVPIEAIRQVMSPALLASPGVRCYLGEVDDRPVTTGLGFTAGSQVGIFSIGTPPAHRGHGYGSAVTARAASDGLDAGAEWAWLQASPAGFPIYERMGFRTVEVWSCWLSEPEPQA
jgi:ribosomal protein S18 acetylase RimI-like enzyme